MKKLIFIASILILCACNSSEKKSDSAEEALKQRLSEFMKVTDQMDLDKTMDYIYPKMFTIVPRAELVKAMKESFNNEDLKIDLDSLRVDTLYPIFEIGKGQYARIKYSMTMRMQFLGADSNTAQTNLILKNFSEKYGESNVRVDPSGVFVIKTSSPMVAVKDEQAKEWSFINLSGDDETILKKILSQEVLDKLATYN